MSQKLKTAEVVNGLLSLYDAPQYLEIGVHSGETFHNVSCRRKVAVDPNFRFEIDEARTAHPNATYHPVTSDAFFGKIVDPATRFDIIFLDGLHTSAQTLRDLGNALFFLAPGGVILIDDVRPVSYTASLTDPRSMRQLRRALNIEERAWMGDVYRLVFFIETFFQQLSYNTIAENHGQLVVWRSRRADPPGRTIEEVGRIPFEWIATHEQAYRTKPFAEILQTLRAYREEIAEASPVND